MRLGCNSRFSGVTVIFLYLFITLYPFYSYAFLPLLAARSVLSTVVSRVVVNRAMQSAANDAVYLTLVNNTRRSVTSSIMKKASSISSNSFYRGVGGALTWAGVGYTSGTISANYFSGNDYVVATSGKSDGNGKYIVSVNGIDYVADFLPSESSPFIALVGSDVSQGATIVEQNKLTSEMGPYFYYITSSKIAYGSSSSVAQAVLAAKDFSSSCKGRDSCTATASIKSITTSSPVSAALVVYDLDVTFKNSKGEMTTITTQHRFQLSFNSDYVPKEESPTDYKVASDKDGFSALEKLKDVSLSLDEVASFINQLLLDASSQPGYDGIPFSPSNPVTGSEISKVYPDANKLNKFDWLYPSQNGVNGDININVDNSSSNPDSKPDIPSDGVINVDLGDYPEPTEPDISNVPSASEILQPIVDLFPFLKGFDISKSMRASVSCPTASFELFDKTYHVDTQCVLFEQNRWLIQLVSSIVWAFISLRIILSA
ncbi:hypothetical protein AXR31_004216 [Salmonella enterica subsp. enterica serovar Braenderup]|nr:hypothetical protein [Salmonella enterica subsp. enterica serovar Braenderup]